MELKDKDKTAFGRKGYFCCNARKYCSEVTALLLYMQQYQVILNKNIKGDIELAKYTRLRCKN